MQLTQLGGPPAGTPGWSPDGHTLVFDARLPSGSAVFMISADGGTPRQMTNGTTDDLVPSFSRNGQWIYFASKRTGELQVWKMPVGSGAPVQITRNGGFRAFESNDGRYIYYAKSGSRTSIWRQPVDGGRVEELVLDNLSSWQNFSLTPAGIYYAPISSGDKIDIQFYDFGSRTTRDVSVVDSTQLLGVAASRDGESLLVSRSEVDRLDLMLLNLF
jgi:Tol biopolymer transport system component